jgi:pantothenate kinase
VLDLVNPAWAGRAAKLDGGGWIGQRTLTQDHLLHRAGLPESFNSEGAWH